MKPIKIACMMRVKNEGEWLRESLTITSQFVDYITILDDGSTDNTAEICKSFPKVRYHYQEKEVDEVRDKNLLLNRTLEDQPDWILCLDGDEVLEKSAGERIKREIGKIDPRNPKYTHFQMQILYFWNDKNKYRVEDGIYGQFWKSRLFTTWGQSINDLSFFTTDHGGNLHCSSIPTNVKGKSKPIDVKIKHYGYLKPEIRERKLEFYQHQDRKHAEEGYYDHLTDETGMILAPWIERNENQFSAFAKDSSYYHHQRTEIVNLIPKNAKYILDVGCANGGFGKMLKEEDPNRKVYGIELDPLAANYASLYLDDVLNENIEIVTNLPFEIDQFDVIFCGDILEHLIDPYNALQFLSCHLKDDGFLITSIPNVRHLSVIQMLLNGNWSYDSAGIMDETHLRFFTLKEMKKVLLNNGFEPEEIIYTIDQNYLFDTPETENSFSIDTPNYTLKNLSKQDTEELKAVQYIIKSSKISPKIIPDKIVSIIIVTLNQIELTDLCISSILENTTENYEIIVIDNGSADGTIEYLRSRLDIKLIENGENKGFAAACNIGIANAKGDYLVFLNNDTVVTSGWLSRLVWHGENDENIGLVGPLTNYAGSIQQIKDLKLNEPNIMRKFAQEIMVTNLKKRVETDFLSGFCLLAKRSVIERIGGFDEQFLIGNYEDDDFCLRAKLAGFQLYVAQDVYVHHFGSATFKGEKINYADSIETNWELFKEKWNLPEELSSPKENRYNYLNWVSDSDKTEELYIPLVKESEEKLVSVLFFVEGNQEKLLQSMNSLIGQKYRNFEVIFLDHHSGFSQKPNFTKEEWPFPTLSLQLNGPKATSLLKGLKLASGEYIAYILEGDIFYPNHLVELVKRISSIDEKIVYAEMYMSENHATKLPLASFLHSNECLTESLFCDKEMLYVPDEAFHMPLLKYFANNFDFVKLDQLTGEADK